MPTPLRSLPIVALLVHCLLLSSLWLTEAGCPYGHDSRHSHRRRNHHRAHTDDDDTTSATSPLATADTDDTSSETAPPPSALPSDYESWTAAAKLRYVWGRLRANETTADQVPLSEGLIFTESLVPTVAFNSDLMPAGRRKAIHGDGVVCKVQFRVRRMEKDMGRPSYTGVLEQGSDTAILRFSSVLDPSVVGGVVPSIAIKVFRDGELSANIVALNTQQPQTVTSNPFFLPMTNQFVALPPAIIARFLSVTKYPNFTGTSQWASSGAFHSRSQPILFPWQLIFVPNSGVQQKLPQHYQYNTSTQYYSQLLPPALSVAGELLYSVFALDRPGEQAFLIGDVMATTDFHRSDFGDRKLFFKHTLTEEDVFYRPEFGVLCPHEDARCSPCPQTYNCLDSTWHSLVDYHSVYGAYYNNSWQYDSVADKMRDAFGTPQYPGPQPHFPDAA